MDTKGNMKQAMYEMFGVGMDRSESAECNALYEEKQSVISQRNVGGASFFSLGTVFEGKLYSDGDVDVAGVFKGSITAKGRVRMSSDHQGDVTAGIVELVGGMLEGDITAVDTVIVRGKTIVCGNITAKELICEGEIKGNITLSKGAEIGATARIEGDIIADTLSIAKGAVIKGGVEIKASAEPKSIVAPIKPIEK